MSYFDELESINDNFDERESFLFNDRQKEIAKLVFDRLGPSKTGESGDSTRNSESGPTLEDW